MVTVSLRDVALQDHEEERDEKKRHEEHVPLCTVQFGYVSYGYYLSIGEQRRSFSARTLFIDTLFVIDRKFSIAFGILGLRFELRNWILISRQRKFRGN